MKRKRGRPRNENKRDIKLKRPQNAFLLFSQDVRSLIPKELGKEIPKILGSMWISMSTEQKKPFFDRANNIDEVHRMLYPKFVAPNSLREKYNPTSTSTGYQNVHHDRGCLAVSTNMDSHQNETTVVMSKITATEEGNSNLPGERQPIQPAPSSSEPNNDPILVNPVWSRRGRRIIQDEPTNSNNTKARHDGHKNRPPPITITDPTKVRFRIVPAKKPYEYISREEKVRRKEMEREIQRKKDMDDMKIVTRPDPTNECSGNISTPILVKYNEDLQETFDDNDLENEDIDLLSLMPFSPIAEKALTHSILAPDDKNEKNSVQISAARTPTPSDDIFNRTESEQKEDTRCNVELNGSSPTFSLSSLFSPEIPPDSLGEKTTRSNWWEEFEFLCSPMSRASITMVSRSPIMELSEDPLLPKQRRESVSNTNFSALGSPELARMNTSFSSRDSTDFENSPLKIDNLPLPLLSESDIQFVQNLPLNGQHSFAGKLVGDTENPVNSSLSPQKDHSHLSSNFSYTTTPTEQSLAKLTPSTIEDSVFTTIHSSSSSESSLGSSSDDSTNLSNLLDQSSLDNRDKTFIKIDNNLITASTPKSINLQNEPDAFNLSNDGNIEHDNSDMPDLSPFLEGISNMTSPFQEYLGGILDPELLDNSFGDGQELYCGGKLATPVRKLMETPRTPMRTTQERLEALKHHPITQLTSPNALDVNATGIHVVPQRQERAINSPGYCSSARSWSSPGKHPLLGKLCAPPAKRGRFSESLEVNKAKSLVESTPLVCAQTPAQKRSFDSETQNAVDALLRIQF